MKKYNPKIDYLFCKYLTSNDFIIEDEAYFRKVYKEEEKPLTKEQIIMLKAKRILNFIKIPLVKFNKNNILECYYILTNEKCLLDKEKDKLLDELIRNGNHTNYSFGEQAFLYVLKHNIFKSSWNKEMAKIIHNFIEIKSNRIPTIFYPYQMKKIMELLSNNNLLGAELEMKKIYYRTYEYNISHEYKSLEEIEKIIKDNIKTLKEKYAIEELYIYGSYARSEQHEYSDLDVFVVINKEKINNQTKYKLEKYISNLVKIPVDLLIDGLNTDKEKLNVDIYRHLKQII